MRRTRGQISAGADAPVAPALTRSLINHQIHLMATKIFVIYIHIVIMLDRGLVRAGATGASAPSELYQRVRRTRPESR